MTIQAQAQIAKSQESLTTAVMLDKHPEVLRTYLFKLQEEDHDTYHEASLEICRILLVKIRDRDSNFNDLLEMLSSAIDVRAIELLLTPQSIIELDLTDCVKDYTQHLESILYSDLSDNAFLISWNVINKKILETKYSSSDWTIDDRLANFMINQFVCLFISDSRDKIEQFKIIAKIILCCQDQSVQMKRLEILLGKSAQAIEQMKPTILFTKKKLFSALMSFSLLFLMSLVIQMNLEIKQKNF